MRHKAVYFLVVVFFVFGLARVARAADPYYGLDETSRELGYKSTDTVYSITGTVVAVVLGMLGFVFFGLMIYAGIRWMTARGQEELATKAKETLTAAVIGIIIVVISYALTRAVFGWLKVGSPLGGVEETGGGGVGATGCAKFNGQADACRNSAGCRAVEDKLNKKWYCLSGQAAEQCVSSYTACMNSKKDITCDSDLSTCLQKG